MRYLLLVFFVLPLPAFGAMTAEDFEAYVIGKTMTYFDRGTAYGVEEYLPNRRVRWAYLGDECHDGYWYEAAGKICFLYDHQPQRPQCWVFTESRGRLIAVLTDESSGQEVYEAQFSDQPMQCLGPDVGV